MIPNGATRRRRSGGDKAEVIRDEALRIKRMVLCYEEGGWALRIEDLPEAAWVIKNKARALIAAQKMAGYHKAHLSIQNIDGHVQREFDFTFGG